MLYRSLKPLFSSSSLAVLFSMVFCCASAAQQQTMDVRTDVRHDVSPPLRDLMKNAPTPAGGQPEDEEMLVIPHPGVKPAEKPDPVLQPSQLGAGTGALELPVAAGPTLLLNFEGVDQCSPAFRCAPPDTEGAVGLTQYVQWVNLQFAVFKKSDGSLLAGPSLGNTIWSGFSGDCSTSNDGDPIVTYDKLADRWVFTQFVLHNLVGPFSQCVAVSTTSDALGTYNRYQFGPYTDINDYPKLGVWPDAYYITYNMFSHVFPHPFLGTQACAFDRNKMLSGQAATQVCFPEPPSVGGVLPADVDGHTPPPAGSPNYMVEFANDFASLNLYKFHVDFTNPNNSSLSAATNIPVAPFTPFCPAVRGCVPQQGTTNTLDSLGDRLMYRLAYRNFGDHESLVVNHSVVADPVNQNSGVRWYEIRDPNGTPTVVQQSTLAPDANFRWMGSIAMDKIGDMAVGYSVSSSAMFPSIFVAARSYLDPLSTLQPEISVLAGGGSQTNPTRWGDYSAMQVDPVDDCTFWYTTEYYKTFGSFSWNTRINSFKFDTCDHPDLSITTSHSGNFTQNQTGATYAIDVKNVGGNATDGSSVTVTEALPVGFTLPPNAASGAGWSCSQGTNTITCTRSDALPFNTSYPSITVTVNVDKNAPGFVTNAVTVSGGGEINPSNDSSSDVITVIQLGPDPTITKTHSASFTQGQPGTYTITVTNVGLSPLSGDPKDPVTVTDTLPTGLTATAASGTGWTCTLGPPSSCTRSDTLASNASYPAITLTVNVATNAPPKVTNTATVSGGGDVNPLNNTANDPTTIILVPNLSITKTHTGNFNQGQNNAQYTLTVSDAAGAAATSGTVTVTDTLPSGLTAGGVAAPFPWNCSINPTTLTCTRSDVLAAGSSYPAIIFVVSVANDAPASVTNTATVSGGGDPSPGKTASDPTTINASPDLTIKKSHTPEPFIAGMTGTYTITVSNVGHADTSGTVTVTDSLPLGLTATSVSAVGWTCPTPPTASVNCTRSDALAAGNSYPAIAVTVSVTGGGPGVTNFVNVNGGGEFNLSNDFASDFTHITAPVLSITKSHVGNFTVGQNGTYTITASNTGPIATIGTTVTVTDALPTGLTATAMNGSGWSCSVTPTTCTRPDVLPPNNSYPPITLTVSVDGNASATVFNNAFVTGGGDSGMHFVGDLTNINLPDLAIAKSHNGNFVTGQTGATYTITVSNVGTIPTAGGTLNVTDILPFPLTAATATGTGWTCTINGSPFVTCSRDAGVLAPNSSYPPITLGVNVGTVNGSQTVTNQVSVGGIGDSNLANNTASDVTTIVSPVSIVPSGSTAVTVSAGSPAAFGFTANLVSSPPVGTVSFNLSGALPQNSKATFSPASVTQTGPVTLTMDTSGNGHVASAAPVGLAPGRVALVFAALLLPLLLWTTRIKTDQGRRRAAWLGVAMCISGLALLAALSGCGGGSRPPLPPPPPVTTPPGTYFMTVTATSSVSGVPPSTMSITLTVR
jgi:uncharacterized repeat protein (TIGR01451 family)